LIRVLAVTSSALLRAGLEALASNSARFEVVSSGQDVEEAGHLLASVPPDLIVVEWDPAQAQDLLDLAASPDTPPILLLGSHTQPPWISGAVRSGIRGIVPRDLSNAEMVAAIEAVAAGLIVLHPQELDGVLATGTAAASDLSAEALSPREIEVLRLMAEGLSNKTIAWKLSISEHTVKFHVNSILTKMNAGSRTEAVTLGLRRGLVPL
jgi:NarL family two-component system response regulator YdfI